MPRPWEWVFSQHSCPSSLWQPNPDLYLWLVLRGESFLPFLHWQEAFNGIGIKSWGGSGLNPVPPKGRGFFLPCPSSNGSLPVFQGDRVFCSSPSGLGLFALNEGRAQPGGGKVSCLSYSSFLCMPPNQGRLCRAPAPHSPQLFLMNTRWRFWKELVSACKVPQYLRLPGVLYCHVSSSLAFSNSLFQLISSYLLIWWSTLLPPMLCYR